MCFFLEGDLVAGTHDMAILGVMYKHTSFPKWLPTAIVELLKILLQLLARYDRLPLTFFVRFAVVLLRQEVLLNLLQMHVLNVFILRR